MRFIFFRGLQILCWYNLFVCRLNSTGLPDNLIWFVVSTHTILHERKKTKNEKNGPFLSHYVLFGLWKWISGYEWRYISWKWCGEGEVKISDGKWVKMRRRKKKTSEHIRVEKGVVMFVWEGTSDRLFSNLFLTWISCLWAFLFFFFRFCLYFGVGEGRQR